MDSSTCCLDSTCYSQQLHYGTSVNGAEQISSLGIRYIYLSSGVFSCNLTGEKGAWCNNLPCGISYCSHRWLTNILLDGDHQSLMFHSTCDLKRLLFLRPFSLFPTPPLCYLMSQCWIWRWSQHNTSHQRYVLYPCGIHHNP